MLLIAAALKEQAHLLGFTACGITRPDAPTHLAEYRDWLAQGYHAGMHYLASERALACRENPASLLPGCQSILVLATPYYQGEFPRPPADQPSGKVARYAWNDDYHDVLLARSQSLMNWLASQLPTPFTHRIYVDSGALLERELAQQAGLGWVGKNSLLINRQMGSFFLLSEILLSLALPPDLPHSAEFCGTCTRCIDACPTDAILPGKRSVDARRCISYLTIENKGEIPEALSEQLSGWVFGCDICQDVCPWNRFAQPTADPAFAARTPSGLPNLSLQELCEMSPESYQARFRRSPLKRAKLGGLQRNAKALLKGKRTPTG